MTTLDENQKNALCSSIRTSRYSRKVVTLLRDMSDSLYKTEADVLMTSMEHSMDEDLLSVFSGILKDVGASNPMDAEQKLRNVIEFIRGLEEVSFVIPIHPNKEFVRRMYDWCAENIRNEILVDFTVNRLMESGVLMIYKWYYFEYSLENLLDEYFSTHEVSKYFDVR